MAPRRPEARRIPLAMALAAILAMGWAAALLAEGFAGVTDPDGREVFRLGFLPKGQRNPLDPGEAALRDPGEAERALAAQALAYWAGVIVPRDCPGEAQASCVPRVVFLAGGPGPAAGRPRVLPGLSADYNLVLAQSLLAQGVPRTRIGDRPQDAAIAVSLGDGGLDSPGPVGPVVAAVARGLGLYAPGPGDLRDGGRDTQFGRLIARGEGAGQGPGPGAPPGEGWLFTGPKASQVYGDGDPRPIPMAGQPDSGGPGGPGRGDFRLRNTPLSGPGFCNYAAPVEAELAALADLGYDVALRRAYGRSVYRDGTTVANGADFQSALPHGVGLHVYGSFNTVTQEADISSSGPGGAGIRVDGRGNSVTVSRDSEVRAVGPGGSGILVAWGSGHSIASLGAVFGGDDAARFDLGAGIPGLAGGEDAAQADGPGPPGGGGPPRPASFHRPAPGAGPWEREAGEMLDGPLVRSFTVAGLLHGGKRAFYASSDAYVESLGLVRGASVFGDIVSDYDDLGRGTDRATAVYAGGSLGALDRPDPGFSLTLSGRVLGSGRGSGAYSGRGLIDLALVGGTTSLPDSARVDVRGFTLEPGATLELRPDLANLRPIFLEADSVAFKEGSVIRVSESTGLGEARSFFFVPVLKVGKRGDGGFLNLASLELDPASSLSGGELRWYSPGPDEFLLAYVSRGAGLPMAD